MKETKSVWTDIATVWKRVAAVITASGALSAFLVSMFNFHAGKTVLITSAAGIIILVISFYVDRQTKYIEENFHSALTNHENEAAKEVKVMTSTVEAIKDIASDTRKDTLRIQLMMMIQNQPENTDTILKLAETYFVKMHGDWYMTSEFRKWSKAHKIDIPESIFSKLSDEESDK